MGQYSSDDRCLVHLSYRVYSIPLEPLHVSSSSDMYHAVILSIVCFGSISIPNEDYSGTFVSFRNRFPHCQAFITKGHSALALQW